MTWVGLANKAYLSSPQVHASKTGGSHFRETQKWSEGLHTTGFINMLHLPIATVYSTAETKSLFME